MQHSLLSSEAMLCDFYMFKLFSIYPRPIIATTRVGRVQIIYWYIQNAFVFNSS